MRGRNNRLRVGLPPSKFWAATTLVTKIPKSVITAQSRASRLSQFSTLLRGSEARYYKIRVIERVQLYANHGKPLLTHRFAQPVVTPLSRHSISLTHRPLR